MLYLYSIKKIREANGLTQKELAELSGTSLRMISYYEQGYKDIRKANIMTAHKIAQALGCTIDELLGLVEFKREPISKALKAVIEKMQLLGLDTEGVRVVAPSRGPERWVVKDDCVIGNYNCKSKELIIH